MTKNIAFGVECDDYQKIHSYARIKGFDKPGILARFALNQYMRRFPITASERAAEELCGIEGEKAKTVQSVRSTGKESVAL